MRRGEWQRTVFLHFRAYFSPFFLVHLLLPLHLWHVVHSIFLIYHTYFTISTGNFTFHSPIALLCFWRQRIALGNDPVTFAGCLPGDLYFLQAFSVCASSTTGWMGGYLLDPMIVRSSAMFNAIYYETLDAMGDQ